MMGSLRQRLLVGQAFILLYSGLAAVLGRTTKTFVIIMILFILYIVWQSRRSKAAGPQVDAEEIDAARVLFEEKKGRDYQMEDVGLVDEVQEQAKATMYMSIGSFITLGLFFLLWPHLDAIYNAVLPYVNGNERLAHFIAFLVYFEIVFAANNLSYIYAMRKTGKMIVMQMPTEFRITQKGIVFRGLLKKQAVPFPLPEGFDVRYDEKRRFVELVKEEKDKIVRLRLYTGSPRRAYDLIRRLGYAGQDQTRDQHTSQRQ